MTWDAGEGEGDLAIDAHHLWLIADEQASWASAEGAAGRTEGGLPEAEATGSAGAESGV